MSIKTMTRVAAARVIESAGEAMATVAEEFDLTLRPERASYEEAGGLVTIKHTFLVKTEGGVPLDFKRKCGLYDLSPEDFGAVFTTIHGTYTVTGINSRRRKYPISGRCTSTGKSYKFAAETVTRNIVRAGQ